MELPGQRLYLIGRPDSTVVSAYSKELFNPNALDDETYSYCPKHKL